MLQPFEKPIPGESLTDEPGSRPYERPPQITKPAEAIEYHLDRLSDPKRMEAGLELLESKYFTLVELVEGTTRNAVASGIHSIDMSLLIAPVIHEFIKQTANAVGIDYDEGVQDLEAEEKAKRTKAASMAKKKLKSMEIKTPEIEKEDIDEVTPEEAPKVEAQMNKGLMSRGAM